MSRNERCVVIGPLVASGTSSQSSKVKAYWGKTIPVKRETPAVPTWHRLGWNSKYIHQDDDSNRMPATSSCSAEHHDRTYGCQHATYARHHTHTQAHTQTQQAKHRSYLQHRSLAQKLPLLLATICLPSARTLVLQQSWIPGMNGAPVLQDNHNAWCSELDGELMHINQTLESIKRRSAQRSQQRQQEQAEVVHDTMTLRANINTSVAKQIEFFTSIQSEWCGHQKGSTAAKPE